MTEDVVDRRASPRERAVTNQVCVEWWAGERIERATGTMLDISEGGALVSADVHLPLGQMVWVHVESPARTDDVSARVVRIGGPNELGLSFTQPCPYDFYLTATLGINPCCVFADH